MRKFNTLFLACAVLASIAIFAVGSEPFALEDLHLIHWEDVPNGRPSYTGPVSAAILMAWYAEHGYPELLPDLNQDGQINEEDTLLLARDFGKEMGGHLIHEQLADPFIVYPLARYIGERYPNEFRMLIYDESFPEEVEHDLGQTFVPTEVGGIVLEVHEDPYYELYVHHLEAGRPGIVGIGPDFPDWNHFTVSRSYIPQEEPEGFPVDLVSTSYELFVDEPVWNTFLRFEFDRWSFLTPDLVPFEILIILIPAEEADGTPSYPGDDPGDGPGGDPGDDPGGDPGDDPGGSPGDIPGGDPGNYPGGDPRDYPSGTNEEGVCCLPDGTCDTTTASICAQRGGAFIIGESCATYVCPRPGTDFCAEVEGEITDICYTYEGGVLKVFASYAITNNGPVTANDITAYALVGLNDGVNGLGGKPDSQDWKYGIDIPAGGTYAYDVVFTAAAPNLDLSKLSYLYGSLWLQVEAPWDCWPIINQSFVQTWDPAPLCNSLRPGDVGTPPGGSDDGTPVGTPPGDYDILGACCLPDGSCDSLSEADCLQRDGLYYGPGTDCAEIRCFPMEESPCAIIRSQVTNACHLYQGPDQPMIVKADFELQNPGDKDALSVVVKLVAGVPLLTNLQTTYSDTYIFTIPIIPAGGSQQFSHTFSINPAPPQQPTGDTVVMVFAASVSPLCKLTISSISDLFHLLYFGPTENICPDDGGTPPGGEGDVPGACCLPDGSCSSLTLAECDRQGGQFNGERTSCESITCESSGEPEPEPQPDPEPDPEPEPEPDPEPTLLPNLWVTGMTGCWTWSGDGQEHVIATVTGIVHNGGQASASNVRATITAGGKSTTVSAGTISAGGQTTVSATIDVGDYDLVSWPVSTSIEADPYHAITEADESNNTTNSSFPQSSECN